ncbi:phenylacetate-coenzyme A ligase [Methanobrevibacter cuticularis]|uniref:Phenylacetate-coenzyme A ligase n=1 Tax=Methanobrevibacter cuticularis TaxID=47311 RepID=A0A166ENV6_9EURY|nr:phenylacetate--CoA ligase [Methanobrevibacter cuticularis]KZX16853.1 phenylacetate-coenzyme A ligase [Methanobrevibacter cuticularis]
MVWNEKAECMDREEKEKLQLERLKDTVKKAYENVEFYKKRFDEAGVKPEDIQKLKDIEKLPFTTKADLRDAYPFGMFAVPEEDIIEIHTTSGTTGKPTVSGYTKKDIDIWGEIIARAIDMSLGTKKDRIQNCYGYGLFTGGLGIHHGGHKLGATVIPISAGNTKRQIEIMQDFQSTILTCTPSYALYLSEILEKEGVNLEDLNLKSGIFGAEMWTEEMRNELEKRLGIVALNIYGLTEIMGPGVSNECTQKKGLHISDDHFYPEIIDSDSKKTLNDGEKGELVLTTLTREGMPVIRFRTKDITSLNKEKCDCGRTTVRMSRITGRTDDMLKIRGVIVFPSQIERALLKMEGLTPNYQIIITRPEYLDEIEVQVEASPSIFSDEMKEMEDIENKIAKHIHTEIGLRVNVRLVESESLPRSEGKAIRVLDKRNLME